MIYDVNIFILIIVSVIFINIILIGKVFFRNATTVSIAMFLRTFYIALFVATICSASPEDWKTVERLIEETPYIVALLKHNLDYICTGTIISKIAVLTSGTCVSLNPKRVAVGVAVVSKKTSESSILYVAYTRLHGDYNFEMKAAEPNVTRMHSNIGLVFVTRPMLELYISAAEIGNYYASELQDIELTTVGYGEIKGTRTVVLQYKNYSQAPCANPKWYYCICGVEEFNTSKTYEKDFGNGAPVLFGDEVVGVTGTASGILSLKTTGVKYIIFTVIGPYLAWIEKADANTTVRMRARSEAIRNQTNSIVNFIYILLLVNIMTN